MRTKTLVLTAALCMAGIASSLAQTNVYSQNVVGYVNVTVAAGGLSLVANQLDTTNNNISNVLGGVPPGTQFYKYVTGSGWVAYTFDDIDGWLPAPSPTLAPGEGGMVRNNGGSLLTITFVGEVLQGTRTNTMPPGLSVRSSIVPQQGDLATLGFPANPGEQVYKFAGGFQTSTFDDIDGWLPNFTYNVGEAFMASKSATTQWIRTFNVN